MPHDSSLFAVPNADVPDAAVPNADRDDQSDMRHRRAAQTADLFRRLHGAAGHERRRLRDEIVVRHLGLAEAVASGFRSRPQDWGDIRQVAYVGLIKAVDRFDPSRADEFASFAVPTIAGEIKRYLRDSGWVVRPPRPLQELHGAVIHALPRIAQEVGHDPTSAEIADGLGENPDRVAEALACRQGMSPLSLDSEGHDEMPLGDSMGWPDSNFDHAELVQTLRPACLSLTPRERRIVYLRFFMEQTQTEIATELGVTQMQISRLLTKIFAQLRGQLAPHRTAA